MTLAPRSVGKVLVQAGWRRRRILIVCIVAMAGFGIAAAKLLPRKYQASSLMLLQEGARANPLEHGGVELGVERIRDKIAGLQALLRSDRVLKAAMRDLTGSLVRAPALAESELADLRRDVSLTLVGADFIEFHLVGSKAAGLGMKLQTVIARFLEALMPGQTGVSAGQIVTQRRKEELDEARRRANDVDAAIGSVRLGHVESRLDGPAVFGALVTSPVVDPDSLTAHAEAKIFSQKQLAEQSQLSRLVPAPSVHFAQVIDEKEVKKAQDALVTASALYDDYVRRFGVADVSRDPIILNAPDKIVLIDPPRDPELPMTSGLLVIVGALLAGPLLGVLIATLAELGDQRIHQLEDVTALTGSPIFAVLPKRPVADTPRVSAKRSVRRRLGLVTAGTAAVAFVMAIDLAPKLHFPTADDFSRIDLAQSWAMSRAAWSQIVSRVDLVWRKS